MEGATAEAAIIRCDAVACVGHCTPSMLESVGLAHGPDGPDVFFVLWAPWKDVRGRDRKLSLC
jgi:hypothetical protein